MSPWFGLVILLALAAFFYKAAKFEGLSMPAVWAGGSVSLYLAAAYGFGWGLCGTLGLQAALFVWLGAWLYLVGRPGGLSWRKRRRHRRIERGCCPECGYDLQGTPGPGNCPECGGEIPRRGYQ